MSPPPSPQWIRDFIVIDGAERSGDAVRRIESSTSGWIVISRSGGDYLYAIHRLELDRWPAFVSAREAGDAWQDQAIEATLDLHEEHQSTKVSAEHDAPPIDRSWRPDAGNLPSIDRYVRLAPDRTPVAIGLPPRHAGGRLPPRRAELESMPAAEPEPMPAPAAPTPSGAPPATTAADDEGTAPVRYPAIDADAPPGWLSARRCWSA